MQQEIHMVAIGANFQKADLVALSDLQTHLAHGGIYPRVKHHAPIFGWTDQMGKQNRYVVTFVQIGRAGNS